MDKAAANRSLSTIHTELEYLRESELLTPEQYQSIMTQLPVRIMCISMLPENIFVRTSLNSQFQVPLTKIAATRRHSQQLRRPALLARSSELRQYAAACSGGSGSKPPCESAASQGQYKDSPTSKITRANLNANQSGIYSMLHGQRSSERSLVTPPSLAPERRQVRTWSTRSSERWFRMLLPTSGSAYAYNY